MHHYVGRASSAKYKATVRRPSVRPSVCKSVRGEVAPAEDVIDASLRRPRQQRKA